jgi:ATP-dependent Zn protease
VTSFSLEEIMRGTRYHEAGHAVAAYHHGYPITGVTVTDAECIVSYRTPNPGSEFYSWVDLWREACITMAGLLADQRAMFGEMRPESWADFLANAEAELEVVEEGEEWLRGDHSDLLQLLQQMSADPKETKREELYRIVVEDSQQLVSDHWTEIEAVARALEQKSTLEGSGVILIIEQASRKEERT